MPIEIRSSVGFGVYSDGHKVHLAEIRQQFGVAQLARSASESHADPASGEPSASLVDAVSSALSRSGISRSVCDLSLSERDCVVRSFDMPPLPRREWKQAVRFEAQKYVPFDLTEVYTDCKTQLDRARRRLSVFFAAAKIQSAERLVEAVERHSLRASSAEPASVSLARLIRMQTATPFPETYAVLDRGDSGEAMILLVKGQSLLMTRSFSLVTRGDSGIEQQAFLSELRLSLNYFAKTLGEVRLAALYLLGGSDEDTFTKLVKTELEVPVQTLNPLKNLSKDQPYSSGLAIACGAALKPFAAAQTKLNLIPADRKRSGAAAPLVLSADEEKELLKKLAVFAALAVFIVIVVLRLVAGGDLGQKERALSAQRLNTPQTPLASLGPDELNAKLETLRKDAEFYDALIGRRVHLTDKLNELARLTPPEIKVTVLAYADGEGAEGRTYQALTVEGLILSAEPGSELAIANKYVATLKDSPQFLRGFDEIKISSVQKVAMLDTTRTQFTVVCTSREAKNKLR